MKPGPLNKILQDIVAHDTQLRNLKERSVVGIDALRAHRQHRRELVRRLLATKPGHP